jgi:exodeoxyribonuclease V alpha subunit
VELIEATDLSDQADFESVRAAIAGQTNELSASFEDLFEEIQEFIRERNLTADQLLRMASLNLCANQFRRIIAKEGIYKQLAVVCDNPYLLYEEYEVGETIEDELSGERIDGLIDIFKIDIALIPLAKYQRRIKDFHDWRTSDCRRLRAVIIQILRDQESTGNCFLERSEIATQARAYSLFYKADTDYEVEDDISAKEPETERHFSGKLVTRTIDDKRFIYLKEIFDDELFVQNVITELHDRKPHKLSAASLEADIPSSIAVLSARLGQRFDGAVFREERQSLYRQIASKSFFVITGFPGSGKSNELLKLIRFFNLQGETHIVLSLTGKAVIRLKNNEEGIQSVNAKTVDKFLYEQQNVNAQAAVSVINNLIIDEASMLDLPKLADVLRSVDRTHLKRLIFVGDPNQLPPIGFGKPFSDVIAFMEDNPETYAPHWARLEVNCRAEMSDEFIGFTRVFSNDSKFAEGHLHQTQAEGVLCGGGLEVVFWQSRQDLQDRLETKVSAMLRSGNDTAADLPKFLGITSASKKPSGLDRFQVLSPYKSGYFGASGMNLFFQDALRRDVPFQRKAGKGELVFKIFDKVMHTQNEYKGSELLVSNGSLGAIVDSGKVFFVDNKGPITIKSLRTQSMLELAYAITVHKSQGSGFGHVFIVLPEKAQRVTRELLYTALTRAKNHVTIFIQQGRDILAAPHFLHGIMSRSAVVGRKTSLFRSDGDQYSYAPDDGVVVKSRVEYIIYRKLLEAKRKYANFSFVYEGEYEVDNQPFNIHPDFVIQLADSRVIYWEHLGRVTSKSYMNDWDKRRAIYESQNDFSKVLTTDELRGISDEKIEQIVQRIVANDVVSEDDSNRYSTMHFSLR